MYLVKANESRSLTITNDMLQYIAKAANTAFANIPSWEETIDRITRKVETYKNCDVQIENKYLEGVNSCKYRINPNSTDVILGRTTYVPYCSYCDREVIKSEQEASIKINSIIFMTLIFNKISVEFVLDDIINEACPIRFSKSERHITRDDPLPYPYPFFGGLTNYRGDIMAKDARFVNILLNDVVSHEYSPEFIKDLEILITILYGIRFRD